jgi:hypothetical protein
MNLSDLKIKLGVENGAVTNGQVNISTGTLTDNINTLIEYCYYDNQPIVIDNVQYVSEDASTNTITIKGQSNFLEIPDLPVEAQFSVDGNGDAQVFLKYSLLGEMPGPNDWNFSCSFPKMPKVVNENEPTYFNRMTEEVQQTMVAPLDKLYLFNAYYVVVSESQKKAVCKSQEEVDLNWGINFVSNLKAKGILGIMENLFQSKDTLTIYGTIRKPLPTETPQQLALKYPESLQRFVYPWDILDKFPRSIPGIFLQIDLDLDYSIIDGKIQFKGEKFYFYTPLNYEWLLEATNPQFAPIHAFTGSMALPDAGIEVDMVAPMRLGVDELYLIGYFKGVSVANLAHLAGLTGSGESPLGQLPDEIKKLGNDLGKLELVSASIAVNYFSLKDIQVSYASFTIGIPDLNWHVWKDHFVIDSINCAFDIYYPLNSKIGPESINQREVKVTVYGTLEIEKVPFSVYASNQDGFTVYAEMDGKETLPLKKILSTFAPGIPAPSELTIDIFRLSIAPHRAYSMALAMAEEPNQWKISVGPKGLAVEDVSIGFMYPQGGPVQGSVSGTICLGDFAKISITYDSPGDVIIRSMIPKSTLQQIVGTLSNQTLAVPDDFNLTFTDSSILMQKQGGNYMFQLATEIDKKGSIALQVQKTGDHWGVAFGLDMTSIKPSTLPGLSFLSTFEGMFSLKKFMLVASTFPAPAFQFPDMANFNDPRINAKQITLPSQANTMVAGLNIFAEWEIDPDNKQQHLLQKFLGLDPSISITLQVSKNPEESSKLFVTYNSTVQGHPCKFEFGGKVMDGVIGLFLTGAITVKIQGQPQTFDVTMLFVPNGAFISADMKGNASVDFDVFKLSQLALEVGINWEGIPSLGIAATIDVTTFQSSVAIFFNSAEPAQSLVAGSVSDLNLKNVLDTFVNTAANEIDKVSNESGVKGFIGANISKNVADDLDVKKLEKDILDAASILDGVLSQIALTGTHSFEISGDLASALDDRKLDLVAGEFFSKGKITIPSGVSETLLVINTKGSIWYLTDLTNLNHYQLKKTGNTITVSLEAQFYCAPQDTSIGTETFLKGFKLNGKIEVLGFEASTTIEVSPYKGVLIDAQMSPIIIYSKTFFSITKEEVSGAPVIKGPDSGGPRISIATFYQPEETVEEFRLPHFYINGRLEMLGLVEAIFITLTDKGFEFDLKGMLMPFVTFDVNAHFLSLTNLGVGGSLMVGVGTIDLGPLGKINIETDVDGDLSIQVNGADITATMDASFEFRGDSHEIANFDLDVKTAALSSLPDTLYDKVKDVLEDVLLGNAVKWANDVKNGVITGVDDVAKVLDKTYKQTAKEAATIMKGAGYAANDVASGLKTAFNASAEEVAIAMKGAGFAANEVASGLKTAFNASVEGVASSMKEAGYAANEVASSLKSAFSASAEGVGNAMKKAGFVAKDIASSIESSFHVFYRGY